MVAREFSGEMLLRKWQRELLIYLDGDPDPRKIVWYVDEKGNTGKTYLSKYMITCRGAVRFENGRSQDIKFVYFFSKNSGSAKKSSSALSVIGTTVVRTDCDLFTKLPSASRRVTP